jgi:hypothetical protein
VYFDGLSFAMGKMADEISAKVLTASSGNNKVLALAGLKGKRMLVIKEVGEQGLDLEVVKMITGEQTISARSHYQEFNTFENNVTVYCTTNTNFIASMKGDAGEAMKGRVVIVPWKTTFIDAQQIDLASAIVAGIEKPSERMSLQTAKRLDIDVKNGTVRSQQTSVAFSMRDGLPGLGAQAMADAWLQWSFDGWLRCLSRPSNAISIAATSAEETEKSFAQSDDIDFYFDQSGLWEAFDGHTVVSTAGLMKSIIQFLESVEEVDLSSASVAGAQIPHDYGNIGLGHDASILTTLRNAKNGMALGKLLNGKRNFGATKSYSALWAVSSGQERCWSVPYRFIGDK